MRSRVEIVADAADGGRPVLAHLRAEGALAVRATGIGEVHLVGTAAGPLGGDTIEVRVERAPRRPPSGARCRRHAGPPRARRHRRRTHFRFDRCGRRDARLHAAAARRVPRRPGADDDPAVAHGIGAGGPRRGRRPRAARRGRWGLDRAARGRSRRGCRTTLRCAAARPGAGPGHAHPLRDRGLLEDAPAPAEGGAVRCPLASGDVLITATGPDVPSVTADARLVMPSGDRSGTRQ